MGLANMHAELLVIASLGLAAGTGKVGNPEGLLRHSRLLTAAYVGYLAAITMWNVPYGLQVVGVCLSVSLLYLVGRHFGARAAAVHEVVLLGRHSLLAYVAQIAVLQFLTRLWPPRDLTPVGLAGTLVAATLLTLAAVRRRRTLFGAALWRPIDVPDGVRMIRPDRGACLRHARGLPLLGRHPEAARVRPSWAPLVWMFLAGSRWASSWLSLSTPISSVDWYSEGSPVDRAVFFGLIVWGLVVLARRNINWGRLLAKNAWLALYLLFCLASVMWTDEPVVLIKRWIRIWGTQSWRWSSSPSQGRTKRWVSS